MKTQMRNLKEENEGYKRELERYQRIYREMIVENKEFMQEKRQFQEEQALLNQNIKNNEAEKNIEKNIKPTLRYKTITCDLPSARSNKIKS